MFLCLVHVFVSCGFEIPFLNADAVRDANSEEARNDLSWKLSGYTNSCYRHSGVEELPPFPVHILSPL